MRIYVVVSYVKSTQLHISNSFDTRKEAVQFITENKFIDKKHNEDNIWIYKLVEVEML